MGSNYVKLFLDPAEGEEAEAGVTAKAGEMFLPIYPGMVKHWSRSPAHGEGFRPKRCRPSQFSCVAATVKEPSNGFESFKTMVHTQVVAPSHPG